MPKYKGVVYRNIQFDGFGDKEARDAFIAGHIVGETVFYPAYTSSSTDIDGYVLDGDFIVHLEIESINGRNMEGYGNNSESEVLFPRESQYIINRIEYDKDGTPTIYLTEEAYGQQTAETETADGRGTKGNVSRNNSGESGSRTHTTEETKVQRLRESDLGNVEVQPTLSAGNTEGDNHREENLREVRAEVKTIESENGYTIGVAESIDEKVKLWEHNLAEVQKDIAEQEKLIAEPFAKQAELDQKRARYNEVMEILNPKEEQSLDSVDEDNVQEQSRDYLGGSDEYGNLDNSRDGGRLTSQYAKKQVAQSSGNISVADRYGGEGRRFARGSGKAILSTDSEGVAVDVSTAKKLSGTSVVDADGHIIAV